MKSIGALLLSVSFLSPALQGAELSIAPSQSGAIVKIGDDVFAEYVINGEGSNMPYLWPIYGPGQKSMTRAYPMQMVDGEQQDHPHHRGLCFGHESLAGVDTWAELATFAEMKASGNQKRVQQAEERLKHLGEIKHREFAELSSDGKTATLVAISDHLDGSGKKLLEEKRTLMFTIDNGNRVIDVDVELIATEGPVRSEDKKDAGISIRVPTSMAVDTEKGGRIINSEGHINADAWAKRAKWCDYSGPVDDTTMGIAILNHPSSFRFPTPWHVRTYGLFTANPFGTHSLDPEAEDGGFLLEQDNPVRLHHRFVFHPGGAETSKIEALWEAYAAQQKP